VSLCRLHSGFWGESSIKLYVAVFIAVLFFAQAAYATHKGDIRVLIIEKERGFEHAPDKDEKLKKLDDVDGRLVLGYSAYLGKLSIWKGDGGLYLVNSLPLEDYVKGVVLAETARGWTQEALKAQAVIVRTFVLSRANSARRPEYHVTSSVLHQVYKGLNSDPGVEYAVNSTMGEILSYNGKPIEAFYHSTSVGRTELPENVFGKAYPYLRSVEASGRLSPSAFWNKRLPLSEVASARGVKTLTGIKVGTMTSTGRVGDVILITSDGEQTIKANDLRKLIGWDKLPSTDFSVYVENEEAVFDGKGWGHGVGLCQWTALEMALDGKSYKEILAHFYPGAEITIYENR